MVVFSLENSEPVQLHVFNSLGEIVYETNKGTYAGGSYQFLIPEKTFKAGLYYFRLEAGLRNFTKKVIVK